MTIAQKTGIVEATEVEVDIITRLLEGTYTAVAPDQKSVDFPLFAYNMDTVLSKRSCDSFDDVPADHEFAFVSDVSQNAERKKYLGVQVAKAAQIREICNSIKHSERTLADELDQRLFSAEAQAQFFKQAMYQAVEESRLAMSYWSQECVKPLGITKKG